MKKTRSMRLGATGMLALLLAACGGPGDPPGDGTNPYLFGDAGKADSGSPWSVLQKSVWISPSSIEEARVLTMNEEALEAKLQVIDSARAGDRLDLVYYLFADDESSAFMADRLIAAVHRGVKVRILLDYFTNVGAYNYFYWIKQMATCQCEYPAYSPAACRNGRVTPGGSFDVRFYNFPSNAVQTYFRYLLTPCSSDVLASQGGNIMSRACTNDRKAHMDTTRAVDRSRMFFSGLYGHNKALIEQAAGPVLAQYMAAAESSATPETDKEDIKKALKLLYNAKIKGNVFAQIAVFFLADQLQPLQDAVTSVIPVDRLMDDSTFRQEWEHWTDFIHQKLTLRTSAAGEGQAELVLGGRNVENSYHLSSLPPAHTYTTDSMVPGKDPVEHEAWGTKYIFMDVDLYVKYRVARGMPTVRQRFERMWNFDAMVVDMEDKQKLAVETYMLVNGEFAFDPYGPGYIQDAVDRFSRYYSYDRGQIAARNKNADWPSDMYEMNKDYQMPTFELDETVRHGMYYLENIPNPNGGRTFGTGDQWGNEVGTGKYIHSLWLSALEDVCKNGDGEQDVIFHNAYLLLPTRIQRRLQQAVMEPSTCPGVRRFEIITNSRESTDLNIINIYNESYIKPMLEGARKYLVYREYITDKKSLFNPVPRSLHAKVMIFGDNIWIGSANADGRSEFMDANNGMYIAGAPRLVEEYTIWLEDVVGPLLVSRDPHDIKGKSHQQLMMSNLSFLNDKIVQRWLKSASPDQQQMIMDLSAALMDQLYTVSKDVLLANPNDITTLTHIAAQEIEHDDGYSLCDPWDGSDPFCWVQPPEGWKNERVMQVTDWQLQLL